MAFYQSCPIFKNVTVMMMLNDRPLTKANNKLLYIPDNLTENDKLVLYVNMKNSPIPDLPIPVNISLYMSPKNIISLGNAIVTHQLLKFTIPINKLIGFSNGFVSIMLPTVSTSPQFVTQIVVISNETFNNLYNKTTCNTCTF